MNISELLKSQAEKYGDEPFLFFDDEQMSYGHFDETVGRFANGLTSLGMKKGDMVAIMLPNSPAFLISWMGVNRIGAIEVPINTNFKQGEVEYILRHSEASAIILSQDGYELFSKIETTALPHLKHKIILGGNHQPKGATPYSQLLEHPSEFRGPMISEEDPAVCIYTSGTTDRPKGVLNSHGSWVLTGQAYAHTAGISPDDRVMTPNPLFHANAQVYATMGSLCAGASLVLLKRFSASQIIEQSRRYGANKMILVQAVVPWVWERPFRDDDAVNPVGTMIAGNVPKEIYYDFEKRFGLKIQTIYSLTEAVMGIMGPRKAEKRKPGGVGVPMEHPNGSITNSIKIVDEQGNENPPRQEGEIIIRNPAVMLKYLKNPEATGSTKKNGWIYTGDIGRQDRDGYFFFVGRKKEVIRRRGELISPSEIEAVVNRHPKVLESAAIGVPSPLGEGEEEIKLFVRLKPGAKVAEGDIVSWCKQNLAEFKTPKHVEFRDDFPRSAIGRIQKSVLKDSTKPASHK